MMKVNRKKLKKKAKLNLKKHFLVFVILCLVSSFIGAGLNRSLNIFKLQESIFNKGEMFQTNIKKSEQITNNSIKKYQNETKKTDALGRKKGVLATVVNNLSSGSIFVKFVKVIDKIFKSATVGVVILIFISILIILFFYLFLVNVYKVIQRRLCLEGRVYDNISMHRTMYLLRIKKWVKVAWVMFVTSFYNFLWNLTIIGGIIKYYSYILVPYIIAENPDMSANEAITLSRQMMNHHKWECFILGLSFIPWYLLNIITFNISSYLFTDPYVMSTYAEYYVYLRDIAKKKKIKNADKLNDTYLYEKAPQKELEQEYNDIYDKLKSMKILDKKIKLKDKILDFFGIASSNNKYEEEYEKEQIKNLGTKVVSDELNSLSYPTRLYTIKEKRVKKERIYQKNNYLKHYKISSLILLFFIFSMIGWLWEVSLHVFKDGQFVNRGVQHGPWLPIYGAGGVLVLITLYKLRKKPLFEFLATIILCGIVEYFTAFYLELTHGGQKWWDYGGYFINLHGRICAEGLLIFGLGGFLIVYFIAPVLDTCLDKIKRPLKIFICTVLIICFSVDLIYSSKNPNAGKGITDYTDNTIVTNNNYA